MDRSRYSLIRARFLLPMQEGKAGERIEDGYLLTRGREIAEAGAYSRAVGERLMKEHAGEITVIGAPGASSESDIPRLDGALLPAFVKAHGHDHESPLIGIARDEPLATWLDHSVNLFTKFLQDKEEELRSEFGCSPYLIAYRKSRLDDVSFGIGSAMIHHCNFNKYHVAEVVEAAREAGTRVIVAVGSQDRNYYEKILDSPRDAVERVNRCAAEYDRPGETEIIPGPDQLFSNGPEMLAGLKAWARERGKLVHCHSSEEPRTTAWFVETYGMTPVEYAGSVGFLDENTVLAHQVNSTDHDLELLRARGVSIVHNPLANTILGSGMPCVVRMRELGIPVAISTDGSGSADNQNIINAARLASQYQKAFHADAELLPARAVLEMITAVPAAMLRFDNGRLEPGRSADFALIDLRAPSLVPTRLDNMLENIIWSASGNEVRYVMARGELLLDDYTFTRVDAGRIKADVQRLSELFAEYARSSEELKGTGAHQ